MKAQKRGPLPPRKTDRLLDLRILPGPSLEPTILSRIMPTYLQLFFEMTIFRNPIRNGTKFYYRWIKRFVWFLEGLYKLRTRESENLKTVLELYIMEIHRKKAGPGYHRLKTMVKRCIEHSLRINNFEARHGNIETNAVVKNQGTKQCEQRSLGDCWQWKANGKCSKGDNCSFRQDMNKRAKSTQPNPSPSSSRMWAMHREPEVLESRVPSGRMARLPCKDYLKGTCTNSFCEKGHPSGCLFYKSENGCRFGERCSYAHRQVDELPSKRFKKNGDKSAVAMLKITRQLVCVSQDMEPPKSFIDFAEELKHTEADPMCSVHQSRGTSC